MKDCLVISDQTGSLVGLIERLEVLAQVSLRIAASDLFDLGDDVTEEVALDGFSQIPGRMLGHPFADLGDVEQFLLADGIRLFRRHLSGQFSITVSQANKGPHDNETGFIEGELVGIRQPHLEGRLSLLDLFDHAGKPIPVHPGIVQVAAATGPVKETNDIAGSIGRARIKTILPFEDLKRAGLQRPLVPVFERPFVRLAVFRGLRTSQRYSPLSSNPLAIPDRCRCH